LWEKHNLDRQSNATFPSSIAAYNYNLPGHFQTFLIPFIYFIEKIKLMDAKMVIWSSNGHWVAFNVTEAAREWALDVKKNNG
jgi:hypothetical protein